MGSFPAFPARNAFLGAGSGGLLVSVRFLRSLTRYWHGFAPGPVGGAEPCWPRSVRVPPLPCGTPGAAPSPWDAAPAGSRASSPRPRLLSRGARGWVSRQPAALPSAARLMIDRSPRHAGTLQRAAAELFAERVEGSLISKGHSSPGASHRASVSGGLWQRATASAAARGTFASGLSCFVSHCAEARCQPEFLVLPRGRAQPLPSVASPASVPRVPLRRPGLCHELLPPARASAGPPRRSRHVGLGCGWCHASCA